MDQHTLFAAVSIGIGLVMTIIYVRAILIGKTKPHLFSWLTWAIVMGVATALAALSGATASAFTIGNGSLMCAIISVLSLKHGEKHITRSDWFMFLSALSIIPLWAVTKEPLLAAVLATLIDALGYGPTFRKAWIKPYEENATVFGVSVAQGVFNVLAVSPFLLVNGLYPSAILTMNTLLVLMLIIRRRALSRSCKA